MEHLSISEDIESKMLLIGLKMWLGVAMDKDNR